ncbi:sugar ABC transporter ATP-binding protein [Cellulosilyticum sp. I15G10I2]|uniref:sugar ABC transporter ATP-binding protein n=1 Tax=Cellulosilyticum sp. I15G10I2 TaxID=1892843 RepID=UPI00085C9223|nr:sugar ABC transporter ATP-binding protein [Cellulosilyticum sp. I15G10I2]
MTVQPLLTMRGICKDFPGVRALLDVDFTLRAGEIHALLGENGAGKSTLIKVLTGVEKLDCGQIELNGQEIRTKSPKHAQELGISTVYQEVNLCANLSVAENIFIGREPKKNGIIDWHTIHNRTKKLLKKLNIDIDVTQNLGQYSVAIQQMVAIARALDVEAKALILDEPTSSLDTAECEKLFQVMKQLRREGMGIIFVTHFLDQVYAVSDTITILRNGELVGEYTTKELPKIELIGKMIGKDYESLSKTIKSTHSDTNGHKEIFLRAEQVTSDGDIKSVTLNVKKSEVLGLAGLLGSGRSETARAIFGADKISEGTMYINGERAGFKQPLDAIKKGIAYCPEDRKTDAILGNLSIRENIIVALQAQRGLFKFIKRKEQEEIADRYIKLLEIKTPNREQLIKNLSGGNQQKVILARWLATHPELLILDEPTRGIDIGTKAEIQKLVVKLANEGMAVIFISSEMDEMLRCCTRMAVFSEKQKLGELEGDEITEHEIMKMIAGGK